MSLCDFYCEPAGANPLSHSQKRLASEPDLVKKQLLSCPGPLGMHSMIEAILTAGDSHRRANKRSRIIERFIRMFELKSLTVESWVTEAPGTRSFAAARLLLLIRQESFSRLHKLKH